jgi:single-strand DNA-binding protein
MSYDTKGSLNKVMLIGRLGGDIDLKYTPSGAAVATLSIATNTSFTGKDGNKQESTEWHKVVLWNKLAEVIAQYAAKGNRVFIEGRLQTRNWTDKDNVKRYTTEVVASSCQILESRGHEGAPLPDEPEDQFTKGREAVQGTVELGPDDIVDDPLPF